jgi:hypothetical protein
VDGRRHLGPASLSSADYNGLVEVSLVRKQVLAAIERAKSRQQQRRQRTAAAELEYRQFLANVATPVARQLCQVLKAENHPFTVFTPEGGLRLSSDHGRDDYIELSLDTSGDTPQVMARINRVRGSRTLTTEDAVKPGSAPSAISEEDVLIYLVDALEPWLER